LTLLGEVGSDTTFEGGGSGIAITLLPGASGTIIAGIVITNYDQGVLIVNASDCKIYDTIMSSMGCNGIALLGNGTVNNQVYGNIFQSNAVAINLTASSTNNIIYSNSIFGNNIGINVTNCNGNKIYNNNFAGNTLQISISTPSANIWDNGYPSGGNYWSDHAGTDLYRGQYQNETGNDGISDTNYTIAVNNVDRYPLVKPFSGIGIASVITSKTIVGQGLTLNITLKILNYGIYNEISTLTVYGNTTSLAVPTSTTLAGRDSKTITFIWNTTGFALGNYTISAYASPVTGEVEMSDNTLKDGWVVVGMVGDLTGGSANPWDFVPDGVVDGSDLSIVAKCYGSWPGAQPPMVWNVNCDVNDDGVVDGSDLAMIARHFGEGSP
jgi:parallel beta-helix repeat protein